MPTFVIDAPGGGGKVPINPEYVISRNRKAVIVKNYQGKVFVYPGKEQRAAAGAERILTQHNEDKYSKPLDIF